MNKLRLILLSVNGFAEFSDALARLWSEIWDIIVPIGTIALVAYGLVVAATLITSGGDEAKKRSAKTKITWFSVGIVAIFVILVGVPMLIAGLTDWATDSGMGI
jgi:hypothetical protein